MRIALEESVISKYGLSLGEVIFLIAILNQVDFSGVDDSLKDKGLLSTSYDPDTFLPSGLFVTVKGKNLLNDIIMASDKTIGDGDFVKRIEELVPKLQKIYPEGKNFNNQYWRGNKTDIKRKLLSFFKKYGTDITDEQILKATEAYVSGFNGDYKFMRLLQYFIWKEEVTDGTRVLKSELANYIENEGQTDSMGQDWMSTLN